MLESPVSASLCVRDYLEAQNSHHAELRDTKVVKIYLLEGSKKSIYAN